MTNLFVVSNLRASMNQMNVDYLNGASRIVPVLESGAGVVTTRAHVHYVVTEYGVASLYGKTLGERAKALIEIAHPDDRELLEKGWLELKCGTRQ